MSTHHPQRSRPFTLEDASAEGEGLRPEVRRASWEQLRALAHEERSRSTLTHSSVDAAAAARPDAFPWVHLLPEADVNAFTVELADTIRAADSVGDSAPVAQMLIAWQHTAEVHSDPELLAALTRDHGEDYGPVPDPRDIE
ncbi:hypothetical protein ACH4S9_09560 [Streptomyces sp. NPDC021225]|uniref:hypothetical protein n=1 Tax=Streptomyces sp. NPDC021225 TaxID=3365121 RepID=UPI00379B0913